jgi:hypothetical protein
MYHICNASTPSAWDKTSIFLCSSLKFITTTAAGVFFVGRRLELSPIDKIRVTKFEKVYVSNYHNAAYGINLILDLATSLALVYDPSPLYVASAHGAPCDRSPSAYTELVSATRARKIVAHETKAGPTTTSTFTKRNDAIR